MRYFIIFGITIVAALFILFFDPYSEYLAVYENNLIISYDINDNTHFWNVDKHNSDYKWSYESSNDNLNIKEVVTGAWDLSINKEGTTNLSFSYGNDDETIYKIDYIFEIKNDKILWKEGEGTGLYSFPNPIK